MGVVAFARRLNRGQVVILTYHGVLNSGEADNFLSHNFVSAGVFEEHLAYISKHYRPTALRELIACYEKGVNPPQRAVVITFDDGFANNYTVAYPLLRRHGIPFSIFLTTGLIGQSEAQLWTERVKRSLYYCPSTTVVLEIDGREFSCGGRSADARAAGARRILPTLKRLPPSVRNEAVERIEHVCGRPTLRPEERERYDFLTWSQVREMAAGGVDFGSHTVRHPILSTLDDVTLWSEIVESKKKIEDELRQPCDAFAYPNGSPSDFGEREKRALRAAGYRCALSLIGRTNGPHADCYQLGRFNIGRPWVGAMFPAEVSGLLARGRLLRQAVETMTFRQVRSAHEGVRT
jgi:peptidoglycan/xylan/chitin deacetylase (PgdA/CDA1 family)